MAIISKSSRLARESAMRRPQLTQTQKNGQRTRRAVQNWSSLLECTKGFAPIRSKAVRNNTAMLLENQLRWLNENSPAMNTTGMLGPNTGLHGGDLGNSDFYAPGDMRNPTTILPMVRRIYPALMSNDTVGVQPMPGPVALAFAIRYRYLQGANALGDSSTQHVHDKQGANADGSYDARGIRGVETKAKLTTDGYLITVVGQDFPKKIDVVAVVDNPEGQKDVYIHPLLQQIVGSPTEKLGAKTRLDLAKEKANANGTDAEIIKAYCGDDAYNKLQGGIVIVGISNNSDGVHIDEAKFNEVTQKWDLGNSEMGYQRLDTRFTGMQDKRLLEPLAQGRFKFRLEDTGIAAKVHAFEATGAIARTSFGFEKQAVEAGTRRLSTSWTLETQEDLKNTNGIDIDTEATQQMSYELQAEIDREMTVRMLYAALKHDEWTVWSGKLADARWMGERARAFYQFIVKMAMRMRVRNRRGQANFIVCTPDVAALLQMLEDFVPMQVNNTIELNNAQSAAAGTLGGNKFNVYIDERTAVYDTRDYGFGYDKLYEKDEEVSLPNYCMLGYKGSETYDAGIIYCPYIPIMVQTATDTNSFAPHVGLMTRYGVMDNIFGSHLYYHVILIDDFSNPGVTGDDSTLYPNGYLPTGTKQEPDTSFAFPVSTSAATGGAAIVPGA